MGKAECFLCPHFTELKYALIFMNSLGIRYRDTRKVIFLRALEQSCKRFQLRFHRCFRQRLQLRFHRCFRQRLLAPGWLSAKRKPQKFISDWEIMNWVLTWRGKLPFQSLIGPLARLFFLFSYNAKDKTRKIVVTTHAVTVSHFGWHC